MNKVIKAYESKIEDLVEHLGLQYGDDYIEGEDADIKMIKETYPKFTTTAIIEKAIDIHNKYI